MVNIPPEVKEFYDRFLLNPLHPYDLCRERVEGKIVLHARKKIRSQDKGKRRRFDSILKDFMEMYEWKKAKKIEYEAKIKEAKERSGIPVISRVQKFTRYSNPEQSSGDDDGNKD
jgi:hypothetical protein